jgi:hypothetical protein
MCHTKGITQAEGLYEQEKKKKIWTYEVGGGPACLLFVTEYR